MINPEAMSSSTYSNFGVATSHLNDFLFLYWSQ